MLAEAGEMKLAQVKYLWTIPNFSKIYRQCKYIYSPPFAITIDKVELHFASLVTQHTRGNRKYINIVIVRIVDGSVECNGELNVNIEFAVLGECDNVVYEYKVAQNYSHSRVLVDLAIEEAIILKSNKCLHKNELRLVWNITTNDYVAVANRIKAERKSQILRLREFDSFSKLLNNRQFSDVTLCVEGEHIYAHKNILANKSPVFEAMFTHEMSEARSNKVKITDIDYDTMCQLLRYIYTGELGDDQENDAFVKYSNILMAANKYCVESLKVRCEEKLSLMLTIDNVFDCLLLADLHVAMKLRKEAIDFIVGNAKEIVELPLYESFIELHADVSTDVTRALNVKKRRTEWL